MVEDRCKTAPGATSEVERVVPGKERCARCNRDCRKNGPVFEPRSARALDVLNG